MHLVAHAAQSAHVAVVPHARRDVGASSLSGPIAAVLGAHGGPAALGLHRAVARLRPGLLDAEARAVRHLVEAVASVFGPIRTGSKRMS